MNNVEILRKAIKKAQANGFMLLGKYDIDLWHNRLGTQSEPYIKEYLGEAHERAIPWQVILFNHDFAKALWGEEETQPIEYVSRKDAGGVGGGLTTIVKQGWQRHLQQVVIADDPFKYLEQNL